MYYMDFNGYFMRNRAKFTKYLNKNQNFLEKLLEVIYNSFIFATKLNGNTPTHY